MHIQRELFPNVLCTLTVMCMCSSPELAGCDQVDHVQYQTANSDHLGGSCASSINVKAMLLDYSEICR